MADRRTKERKLVALMVNDLEAANLSESEMSQVEEEVRSLPDEELDRTLAMRLDLPHPINEEVMDQVLARVEEPERLAQEGLGGFTGAPDMSHEPRPGEREGYYRSPEAFESSLLLVLTHHGDSLSLRRPRRQTCLLRPRRLIPRAERTSQHLPG